MFDDPSVAGSWPALVDRLDRAGALERWAVREPPLRPVRSVRDLAYFGGAERGAVLGALVRLAAVDGGDESDALLVALHLLSDGVRALATRLRDLHPDPTHLVAGELAAQIRSFPWRRRTGAYAANLLLDTRAALLRELRPGCTRVHPNRADLLIDPQDERLVGRVARCRGSGAGAQRGVGAGGPAGVGGTHRRRFGGGPAAAGRGGVGAGAGQRGAGDGSGPTRGGCAHGAAAARPGAARAAGGGRRLSRRVRVTAAKEIRGAVSGSAARKTPVPGEDRNGGGMGR